MNLLAYRSFTTELLKIAMEVQDSDIRALLAGRRGEEYLKGGQLRSNASEETGLLPKMASFMSYTPISTYNLRPSKKKNPDLTFEGTSYDRASNLAASGLKGGLTGASVGTLAHTLRSGHLNKIPVRHLGAATAVGAGIGIGDKLLRRKKWKKVTEKTANLNPATFSPARELARGQATGGFRNVIHRGRIEPKLPGASKPF